MKTKRILSALLSLCLTLSLVLPATAAGAQPDGRKIEFGKF